MFYENVLSLWRKQRKSMNYPLISEYVEAIKLAEDNFEELSYLRPVLGDDGLPVMTSGNFAVVFKMKDEQSGKFYAVKCFTREQDGRSEAYREITNELKDVTSPYLVSIRYLDRELFVDTSQTTETEFPVLLMEWIEGKTLDKYLRDNLDDKYALEMLAYRFSQLAQWLIPQPFAHGDLKPDNILVREDGTLVLVDYDGMYVPAMEGQKSRELGSPDFRHPLRTENDFDEHIDDFPIASILLSLKAISYLPQLLIQFGTYGRLLFSENDYYLMLNSPVLKKLYNLDDSDITKLVSLLILLISTTNYATQTLIEIIDIGSFLTYTQFKLEYYNNIDNYIDEYGVVYSHDRKLLLYWKGKLNKDVFFPTQYKVKEGTEIICDEAFICCEKLECIYLPESLQYIGEDVFTNTKLSKIINKSYSFDVEDGVLYSWNHDILFYYPFDRKDLSYKVPKCVKKIIKGCFESARYLCIIQLSHICFDFNDFVVFNKYISIPKGTKKFLNLGAIYYKVDKYRDDFFRPNFFEDEITIVDNGVVYSKDKSILYRYPFWLKQTSYVVDYRCKEIADYAFNDYLDMDDWTLHISFNNLRELYLPPGLEKIGEYAFVGCGLLKRITIPASTVHIGRFAFGQCLNLTSITFLSFIQGIGLDIFKKGETLPGVLSHPNEPWKELSYEFLYPDLLLCPQYVFDNFNDTFNTNNLSIRPLSNDSM